MGYMAEGGLCTCPTGAACNPLYHVQGEPPFARFAALCLFVHQHLCLQCVRVCVCVRACVCVCVFLCMFVCLCVHDEIGFAAFVAVLFSPDHLRTSKTNDGHYNKCVLAEIRF